MYNLKGLARPERKKGSSIALTLERIINNPNQADDTAYLATFINRFKKGVSFLLDALLLIY
ncbi:MAG: hypothetical protein K8R86_13110 [Bacteroidales bacterium]|nr:hypothetical protein [Bacteroidales bacterium]